MIFLCQTVEFEGFLKTEELKVFSLLQEENEGKINFVTNVFFPFLNYLVTPPLLGPFGGPTSGRYRCRADAKTH